MHRALACAARGSTRALAGDGGASHHRLARTNRAAIDRLARHRTPGRAVGHSGTRHCRRSLSGSRPGLLLQSRDEIGTRWHNRPRRWLAGQIRTDLGSQRNTRSRAGGCAGSGFHGWRSRRRWSRTGRGGPRRSGSRRRRTG